MTEEGSLMDEVEYLLSDPEATDISPTTQTCDQDLEMQDSPSADRDGSSVPALGRMIPHSALSITSFVPLKSVAWT